MLQSAALFQFLGSCTVPLSLLAFRGLTVSRVRVGKQPVPCRDRGGEGKRLGKLLPPLPGSKSRVEGRRKREEGQERERLWPGVKGEKYRSRARKRRKRSLHPQALKWPVGLGRQRQGKRTSWSRKSLLSGQKGGDAPRRSQPSKHPEAKLAQRLRTSQASSFPVSLVRAR